MATQKQQGIKKRLTKGFTKVAVIGAVAAIIGIGALLIAAAQYEKALNRYGFTQGDIGKAMTAFSESRSALRAVVGYDDEAVIEKQTALHDQKKEAFETYMDELSRTLKFSEGREAYNAVLTELDGYWELDLHEWDVCAANLIVREAGGVVCNFRRNRGVSQAAGNEVLVGEMLKYIR